MNRALEDLLRGFYKRTASWPNQLFIKEFRNFIRAYDIDVNSEEFKQANKLMGQNNESQ